MRFFAACSARALVPGDAHGVGLAHPVDGEKRKSNVFRRKRVLRHGGRKCRSVRRALAQRAPQGGASREAPGIRRRTRFASDGPKRRFVENACSARRRASSGKRHVVERASLGPVGRSDSFWRRGGARFFDEKHCFFTFRHQPGEPGRPCGRLLVLGHVHCTLQKTASRSVGFQGSRSPKSKTRQCIHSKNGEGEIMQIRQAFHGETGRAKWLHDDHFFNNSVTNYPIPTRFVPYDRYVR